MYEWFASKVLDDRRGTQRACCLARRIALLIALLSATGCIPAVNNRVIPRSIVRARIVAMPPAVFVNTVDLGGNFEDQNEMADQIAARIAPYLASITKANGGRSATVADLESCGMACGRLMRWGVIASLEIGAQRAEVRNYMRHSVADWEFRGDLASLRNTLDADYVLLTVFKQTRETTGRKLGNAFSGVYTIGRRIDAACIADLRDGRMTWCATKTDERIDLAGRGGAERALAVLLSEMFHVRPAAAYGSTPPTDLR